MKKVSGLINDLLSKTNPTLVLNLKIASFWSSIISDDLKNIVAFKSAVYIGKNEILITLNVLSSAVILVKYYERSIIEKIKYNLNVYSVNIVFKHVTEMQHAA